MCSNESVQLGIIHRNLCLKDVDSGKAVGGGGGSVTFNERVRALL